MSKLKVWLDDKPQVEWRAAMFPAPEWTWTRWPTDTIALLQTGTVEILSLDHDLDDKIAADEEGRREITGYDVALWIEDQVKNHGFVPPEIRVHSQNGPGRDRILAAARQIELYHTRNLQSAGGRVE